MSTPEQRIGKRAEQKRRWDREHKDNWYDQCDCGERKLKKSARCENCAAEDTFRKRQRIVDMWREGKLMREIAADLGWTMNHLSAEFGRMRSYGYPLPHRYSIERRERAQDARWKDAA